MKYFLFSGNLRTRTREPVSAVEDFPEGRIGSTIIQPAAVFEDVPPVEQAVDPQLRHYSRLSRASLSHEEDGAAPPVCPHLPNTFLQKRQSPLAPYQCHRRKIILDSTRAYVLKLA